jgi:hypothetical protein
MTRSPADPIRTRCPATPSIARCSQRPSTGDCFLPVKPPRRTFFQPLMEQGTAVNAPRARFWTRLRPTKSSRLIAFCVHSVQGTTRTKKACRLLAICLRRNGWGLGRQTRLANQPGAKFSSHAFRPSFPQHAFQPDPPTAGNSARQRLKLPAPAGPVRFRYNQSSKTDAENPQVNP